MNACKNTFKLLAILLLCAVPLALSACGKKAAPHPPGPNDKIIYPGTYPPE